MELVAAKQTKIEVAVLPLLVGNVGIQSIDLSEPSISIVHNSETAARSERPQTARQVFDIFGDDALEREQRAMQILRFKTFRCRWARGVAGR